MGTNAAPAFSALGLLLVLIPVAFGSGITFLIEKFKDDRTKDKEVREEQKKIGAEQREEARQIVRLRRVREEQAAERLDRAFSQLARDLPDKINAVGTEKEIRERWDRIFATADEISAEAAYLPVDLRKRFLNLSQLLRFAHEVGETKFGGTHPHSPRRIIDGTAAEAHRQLAAFLRHEDAPVYPVLIQEYFVGLDEVFDDRRAEFAQEMYEDEEQRAAWRKDRPFFEPLPGSPEPDEG